MDEGFLRLSRRFFSNEMWNEARTFSSCEAWLDLIQSARFEATPRKESIGGREISYSRGQYPASIRFLSQRWKWSEKKVRSFLVHLKKKGMITVECNQGMNLITLCKYEEYNPMDTSKGTCKGTDIEKKIKELQSEWAQLKGTTWGTVCEQQSAAIRTFAKIRAHGGHKYKERRRKRVYRYIFPAKERKYS